STPKTGYHLSPRETEILGLMVEGLTQKQIADRLFISQHTVLTHIKHIYEKLHVHTCTEAVAKAVIEHLTARTQITPH
ncbi:MAG TPA: helix-turn-helix transcriptional regulator, partial [Bacteroidota bacterium]